MDQDDHQDEGLSALEQLQQPGGQEWDKGLAYVFRHCDNRQVLVYMDLVQVHRWSIGRVIGVRGERVEVYNKDLGRTGATVYTTPEKCERLII